MHDYSLVCLVDCCAEPAPSGGDLCLPYDAACGLQAIQDRQVIVEIHCSGVAYLFELEDVCVFGRRSASGACWCVPLACALGQRALRAP